MHRFGAALDVLVDKAVYTTLFVVLIIEGELEIWIAIPLILRDLVLLAGAIWLFLHKRAFPSPTTLDKLPLQMFYLALALRLLGVPSMTFGIVLLFILILIRLPFFYSRFRVLVGASTGESP